MTRYASHTHVSSERSRAEIERTVSRYGAEQFVSGWRPEGATVAFVMHNRLIRMQCPNPSPEDKAFTQTKRGRMRSAEAVRLAWEQACRQRWRALALAIKAKLEAVESGIVTFDEEFLPYIVLPNGQTVGQHFLPQIDDLTRRGQMPKALPGLTP